MSCRWCGMAHRSCGLCHGSVEMDRRTHTGPVSLQAANLLYISHTLRLAYTLHRLAHTAHTPLSLYLHSGFNRQGDVLVYVGLHVIEFIKHVIKYKWCDLCVVCVRLCLPKPAGFHTLLALSIQMCSAAQALVAVASCAAHTVWMALLTSLSLSTKETCGALVHTGTICRYTTWAVC